MNSDKSTSYATIDLALSAQQPQLVLVTPSTTHVTFNINEVSGNAIVAQSVTVNQPIPPMKKLNSSNAMSTLIMLVKQHYQSSNFSAVKQLFSSTPLPLEDVYVNLAIEKEKSPQQHDNKTEQENQGGPLNSSDDMYNLKERVDLLNLFDIKLNDTSEDSSAAMQAKKTLILGRAGMGKSTLCRYIAWQWANNKLWESKFDLILLIKLRDLTRYSDNELSLNEVIRKQCISENCIDEINDEDIELILQTLGKRVLFLLDGFDEIASDYDKFTHVDKNKIDQSSRSKFLLKLIGENKHPYILTSRTDFLDTINEKLSVNEFQRFEVIGFTDQNIRNYIENRVNVKEKPNEKTEFDVQKDKIHQASSQQLLGVMQMNPSLWGIAHVPINLEIICSVWRHKFKRHNSEKEVVDNSQIVTMTQLYQDALLWLLRRSYHRENPFKEGWECLSFGYFEQSDQYRPVLSFLESLAWGSHISLHGNNILVYGGSTLFNEQLDRHCPVNLNESSGTLAQFDFINSVESLGLWTGVGEERNFRNKDYEFIHLTFQEFFAARSWLRKYISTDPIQKNTAVEHFKKYKYHPRFEIVWWFVAGLLSSHPAHYLEEYLSLLQDEPRDIIGIHHVSLLTRCLEESEINIIKKGHLDSLFEELTNWIDWIVENHDEHGSARNVNQKFRTALRQSSRVRAHPVLTEYFIKKLDNSKSKYYMFGFIKAALCSRKKIIKVLLNKLLSKEEGFRESAVLTIRSLPLSELSPFQIERCINNCFELLNDEDKIFCSEVVITLGIMFWKYLNENQRISWVTACETCLTKKNECRGGHIIAAIGSILQTPLSDELSDRLINLLFKTSRTSYYEESDSFVLDVLELLAALSWMKISDKQIEVFEQFYSEGFLHSNMMVRIRTAFITVLSRHFIETHSEELIQTVFSIGIDALSEVDNLSRRLGFCVINILLNQRPKFSVSSQEMLSEKCKDIVCASNHENLVLSLCFGIGAQLWKYLSEIEKTRIVQVCVEQLSAKKIRMDYVSDALVALPWNDIQDELREMIVANLLIELQAKSHWIEKSSVIESLSKLNSQSLSDSHSDRVIEGLLKATEDDDHAIQYRALKALGELPWATFRKMKQKKLILQVIDCIVLIECKIDKDLLIHLPEYPLIKLFQDANQNTTEKHINFFLVYCIHLRRSIWFEPQSASFFYLSTAASLIEFKDTYFVKTMLILIDNVQEKYQLPKKLKLSRNAFRSPIHSSNDLKNNGIRHIFCFNETNFSLTINRNTDNQLIYLSLDADISAIPQVRRDFIDLLERFIVNKCHDNQIKIKTSINMLIIKGKVFVLDQIYKNITGWLDEELEAFQYNNQNYGCVAF